MYFLEAMHSLLHYGLPKSNKVYDIKDGVP